MLAYEGVESRLVGGVEDDGAEGSLNRRKQARNIPVDSYERGYQPPYYLYQRTYMSPLRWSP